MAITFVKDTNGKVLVDDGVKKFSLDPSMNIIAHPSDPELIIITDTSAPLETREAFKFGWKQVTVPANSGRNDLIDKLGKNFFYNSFSASVSFPPGLATEATLDKIVQYVGNSAKPTVVESSTTSVSVIAANPNRKSLRLRNLNVKTCYISTISPATTNDPIYLEKNEIWLEEESTKEIHAIWETGASGDGMSVEEIYK